MSVTALDLFRRQQRVREAVAVVERDKREVATAYERFVQHKIASPSALGAFALAGFAFGIWHYRRTDPGKGIGLSAILTAFFWVSRLFGRHGPYQLRASRTRDGEPADQTVP